MKNHDRKRTHPVFRTIAGILAIAGLFLGEDGRRLLWI